MRNLLHTLLTVIAVLFGNLLFGQSLFINEFMASNAGIVVDEFGEADDWIEIYNAENTPIDLAGMYISDDLSDPTKWQFPNTAPDLTTIPPNGFILIWFDKQIEQGPLHVDMKLSISGEDIVLSTSTGNIIDQTTFQLQAPNISSGRISDGNPNFVSFSTPSPGASNDSGSNSVLTIQPIASLIGGHYDNLVQVTLTSATPDADIYYTLDGDLPTQSSNFYSGPLSINQTTTLRARAFKNNQAPSKTTTHTYLYNISHTFPIVCLSTNDDNFFGSSAGIYENWEEDIEQPVHVEFFEVDKTLGFQQDLGIKIHGTGSAGQSRKGLAVIARNEYGNNKINYQLFPNQSNDEYGSFVLRSSGNEANKTMFRDAVGSSFVRDISDVEGLIKKPDLDIQGYRPCVVYLNGNYFGIHNIREKIDWRFFDTRYGLDKDEVDMLQKRDEVEIGDDIAWNDFYDFNLNNNFANDTDFDSLAKQIDVNHYIDYNLHNIFVDNTDWPGNNNKHWKKRSPDSKWRWVMYDQDFGMGLYPLNRIWDSGDWTSNSIDMVLDDNSLEYFNRPWATLFLRRLMENDGFKTQFINRMADQLNILFKADRVTQRIDDFKTTYDPEWDLHATTFSIFNWDDNVARMRTFAANRDQAVWDQFKDYFVEIDDVVNITLQSNPSNAGLIELNTMNIIPQIQPWSGQYFSGLDIPIEATPGPGFTFDSWSIADLGANRKTILNLSGDATITANFIQGSTEIADIVINEINYNSPASADAGDWIELYNNSPNPVDISAWFFEDEENYFNLPNNIILPANGYLVLVEDSTKFNSVYPLVTNYVGSFGNSIFSDFKLSNNGERIQINNANATFTDEVIYDDAQPWPVEPDGNGPSLQLIDPSLDNAQAANWLPFPATPGGPNVDLDNPLDQSIGFTNIPDKNIYDLPFTIEAFATSGLNVDFTLLSGPATLNGNLITLTGEVGIVTILADQAGSAFFNAAPSVQQSFEVTLVTPENQSIIFPIIENKFTSNPPFTITASSSAGLPIAFTVLSGPATILNGEVTLTGAPGTVTIQASQAGNVFFNPANAVNRSFEVLIDAGDLPEGYCPSQGTMPWVEQIVRFVFGNIDNASAKEGYGDFTNLQTIVTPGLSYPVSIYPEFSWTQYNEIFRIWIDFNRDGAFSDIDEQVFYYDRPFAAGGTPIQPVQGIIQIPPTLAIGPTRMRVSMKRATDQGPCETFERGEVEDYSVFLSGNVTTLDLICPDNISLIVPANETEWPIIFTTPIINSNCVDGENILVQASGPESGSNFPIGSTTVTFEGNNNCDNTSSCNFIVDIQSGNSTLSYTCPDNVSVLTPIGEIIAIASWLTPEPNSNCSIGNTDIDLLTPLDNGDAFPIGTTLVNYEISDDCGAIENCNFTVTVEGQAATLNLECPENITISTLVGASGAIASWALPNTNSNCNSGISSLLQITGLASGSEFPIGISTVTYQATDACENEMTCSFSIEIQQDALNYNLTCPENLTVTAPVGANGIIVDWNEPNANTNCEVGTPQITQIDGPINGSVLPIGTTNITYQYDTGCNESTTCDFNVTVQQIPLNFNLECPENISVTAPIGANGMIVTWNEPNANTNCEVGTPQVTQIDGPTNGSVLPIGTTTITYLYDTGCEETLTCSFEINVTGQAGVLDFSCPQNISINSPVGTIGAIATWEEPNVSSNCSIGTVSLDQTIGLTNGSFFPLGTTNISYEAQDGCDNLETCVFSVSITQDDLIAEIVCPDDIIVNAASGANGAIITWDLPNASTNCSFSGNGIMQLSGPATGSFFLLGNTVIEYIFESGCEDNPNCSFNISVVEESAILELSCPENIVIEAPIGASAAVANWMQATTTTNCSLGEATLSQTNGLSSGSAFPEGTTTVTYQAEDDCGNLQTCEFTVTILTQEAVLQFSCPADISENALIGAAGVVVTWPEPVINSDCSFGTSTFVQIVGPDNGSEIPVGTTTITYEAMDNCENIQTCSFDIIVTQEDLVASFDCPDDLEIMIPFGSTGQEVVWAIPQGNTNCELSVPSTTQIAGPSNGSFLNIGTNTVEYSYNTGCNLELFCNFDIILVAEDSTVSNQYLEQNIAAEITIYPIPADSKLNYDAQNLTEEILNVSIYNNLGQKIGIIFHQSTDFNTIDIKNYPNGVYLASFQLKNGMMVNKQFVISR